MLSAPIINDVIETKYDLEWAKIFAPVFLLILQSYFKSWVIAKIALANRDMALPLYWCLRICLIAMFVRNVSTIRIDGPPDRAQTLDLFQAQRSKRDPLLVLRAVACMNVFLGHWFLIAFGPAAPASNAVDYALRMLLSLSPWCGFWMFFTLSGYLITKGFVTGRHSVSKRGLAHFYRNRILRIFPEYFLVMFLVAAFLHPDVLDLRRLQSWNTRMDAALFDQGDGALIGALWSVSTEFQFYIVAPFIFLLCQRLFATLLSCLITVGVLVACLAVGKVLILHYFHFLWHSRVYCPLITNLDCFVTGGAVAYLVNWTRVGRKYLNYGIEYGFLLLLVTQVILSCWSYPEMIAYPGVPGSAARPIYLAAAPGLTALATGVIIFLMESSRRYKRRTNLVWRVSQYIGTTTYCIYVVHEPILIRLEATFPSHTTIFNSMAYFPFGAAIVLGVASLVYFHIEKHYDRLRS